MNEHQLVPHIRFWGFEDEWEQRKLGEVAEIVRGASPRPIKDPKWFDDNSDIGWLRISDVTEQDGKIFHLEQHISVLGQKRTRVLTSPHLLLSIAASVGKPVINHVKTGVHDGFLIFLNPKFNINFMYYWLEMYQPNWQRFGQPGSQVNLNSDLVKNQIIIIPDNNEQQSVSSFFNQLDTLITLQQQKIDQLGLLKKALLQDLFPAQGAKIPALRFQGFEDEWKLIKIENIVQYRSSSFSISELKETKESGFYPVYDAAKNVYYSNKYDMSDKYIAIIKDGSNVGNTKFLPAKTSVLSTMGYLQAINSDILFDFYIIKKINFDKYKVGSGIPHIYFSDYKKEYLHVPLLSEQQKIGTFLAKLDHLIELEQQKLDKMKQVKKALLQNMFVE
jgi:type I restriction enzyme, S subunit